MKKYKLTIGIPIFNGEKNIDERIKEILSQTYSDFCIIISDNGSTDTTRKICENLSKIDTRITFFHNKENRGVFWNFNFLLNNAETEYVVIAPLDDIWSKNFLESNINILENSKEVVGSIGECSLFNRILDPKTNKYKKNIITNIKKYQYTSSFKGNLEEKIKSCLYYSMGTQIYSVFRTNDLKFASFYKHDGNHGMWQTDLATILKILKKGNLHVDTESFFYKEVSQTSHSLIKYMKIINFTTYEIIFSKIIFSTWFLKEFGPKLFFKNLPILFISQIKWIKSISGEALRICKRIMMGQEKYW